MSDGSRKLGVVDDNDLGAVFAQEAMDVNEQFEQWLQSLTKECEAHATQIKGDEAATTPKAERKRDKKKKRAERKMRSQEKAEASRVTTNGVHSHQNGHHGNGAAGNLHNPHGHSDITPDSFFSNHDDLNEILNELASFHDNSPSTGFCGDEDLEPTIDLSGGMHVNSADGQSPRFMYAEANSSTYTYFQPRVLLAPENAKSEFFDQLCTRAQNDTHMQWIKPHQVRGLEMVGRAGLDFSGVARGCWRFQPTLPHRRVPSVFKLKIRFNKTKRQMCCISALNLRRKVNNIAINQLRKEYNNNTYRSRAVPICRLLSPRDLWCAVQLIVLRVLFCFINCVR